jgi:ribosomal protein RSM22 (predicted rRNA methylase)
MEAFNRRQPYRLSPRALRVFEAMSRAAVCAGSSHLVGSITRLSTLFTQGRDGLDTRYLDDPDLVAGYTAYFLPLNFAKIQMLLEEMPAVVRMQDRLSVLDLGCGPGTASLAVLDWILGRAQSGIVDLQVTAVDHSRAALGETMRLWNAFLLDEERGLAHLAPVVERLDRLTRPDSGQAIFTQATYDTIIIANSLNELFRDATDPDVSRVAVVERCLSALKPDGTLMIVEPALRTTARSLHRIRDLLLAKRACTVYSPCLHEQNCPALAKVDDWCHEERPWVPPDWIASLDKELGFIKDALKFSYLLLRKDGRTVVERRPDLYRVVSELRVFKGEKRAWLCNELGRSEVGRLDRLASPRNVAVDEWHRGALVQIERIVRKERNGKVSAVGRIEREASVQIVRSV